jgi:capsular exopolysaccharide synthesis family protein
MSRVYDALQKSQGENLSASPLVSSRPEAAHGEATAVAVAAGVPISAPMDANWLNVPADRILRPTPTPEQRLVALSDPNSQGAEMFRVLATRLAHMQNKRRLQKLLITSSVGDEGKSVVAVNLALTLARRHEARTLLIEADLRRPSASNLLTASSLRGISDWDAGTLAIEDSLYRVGDLPLWLLSAGQGLEEPLPLLESDRFAKMLDTISSTFDWVLLDATPMLPMADATSLSRLCDGVLVVVREGFTRRKVLDKALESIEKPKLLGVVFNQASMLNIDYDRYYGGNGSSGKSKKEAKKESKKETDKVTAATA